jgi:ribonuclease J
MINLVKPKFFVPVHGELRHLIAHSQLAGEMGIPEDNIAVVENGTILELDEHTMEVGPRIPGGYIFVDGSGVGDVGPKVLRDRERLANSGFFIAVVSIDDEGTVTGRPEIISRGFVYLDEAGDIMKGAEEVIVQTVRASGRNRDHIYKRIEGALSKYLYAETGRRPMVYTIVK